MYQKNACWITPWYEILEHAKPIYSDRRQTGGFPRLKVGEETQTAEENKRIFGETKIFWSWIWRWSHKCIHLLIFIIYIFKWVHFIICKTFQESCLKRTITSFARCYHGSNWVKGTRNLCIMSHNCIRISIISK